MITIKNVRILIIDWIKDPQNYSDKDVQDLAEQIVGLQEEKP